MSPVVTNSADGPPPPDSQARAAVVAATPLNWRRGAIVLAAALGWWLSFDLLRLGAGASATNPLLAAVCSAEPESDCASVLQSNWGRVTLGTRPGAGSLPLSVLGMAYFGLVFLWFVLLDGPYRGWARLAHLPITTVVLIAAAQSATLIHVMANVLQRWCGGCVATHAANGVVALLCLSLLVWPARGSGGAARLPRAAAAGIAGLFFGLFQVAYVTLMQNALQLKQLNDAYTRIVREPAYAQWQLSQQTVTELPIETQRVLGPASAPNLIQAFVDPQCRVCRELTLRLADVERLLPGRIRVIYRNYPLDRACNPSLPGSPHASACAAARRLVAARGLAGTVGEHRLRVAFYDRQSELGTAPWWQFASTAQLDATSLEQAAAAAAALEEIEADIALARSVGVATVPVVYLNGRRFDSWRELPLDAWDGLLAKNE